MFKGYTFNELQRAAQLARWQRKGVGITDQDRAELGALREKLQVQIIDPVELVLDLEDSCVKIKTESVRYEAAK